MNILTLNQVGAVCLFVGVYCITTVKFDLKSNMRADNERMRAFRKTAIPAPEYLTAVGRLSAFVNGVPNNAAPRRMGRAPFLGDIYH